MFKISKIIMVFLIAMLFSSVSFAKELTVGVGLFEPFFIKKDNRGVFSDLIKETFKRMPQYKIKFLSMNNRRLLRDLNIGRIDAAANIFKSSAPEACLSDPMFRYTDVAVTLKKKNFVINSISDLQGKSIAVYENAMDLLGDEFRKMAASNPGYEEFAQPFVTTNLLVRDRKDVRIGDIFIFLYDINRPLHKDKVSPDEFTVHRLFPDVYSYMGFKDKKICDEFNQALREIKAGGAYEAVYEKYERFFKGLPEN